MRIGIRLRSVGLGLALCGLAAGGGAQTTVAASTAPVAAPEFEAATIKPVKNADPRNRGWDRKEGRRLILRNFSLAELLLMNYQLDRRQIAGGPGWVTSELYDVDAVAESKAALDANDDIMLRKLLTDRFRLAFHWEQREMTVYAMTVAKGGPKLTRLDPAGGDGASCERLGQCTFRRENLQHFARWLQFTVLDKPVVDKTGLTGEFDFKLKWTPDDSQFVAVGIRPPTPSDDPSAPPGLYRALEEQLGLKVEVQKTPTPVMVIDHVERPTEN